MCGLAGFNLSSDESVDARVLARHLLLGIEERGTDATGIAYFEDTGAYLLKAAVPAQTFIADLHQVPASTTTAVLHTRFATKGATANNDNNHPIDAHGILGVHNGVIWNDDDLFERIGAHRRLAQVDSEAIFATVLHGGEPPAQALARVQGSAAVAWLDTDGDPHLLHAARVASSPFIYATTEAGSFVFASTAKALMGALRASGLPAASGPFTLGEGTYLQVHRGQVIAKETFSTGYERRAPLSAIERKALNLV